MNEENRSDGGGEAVMGDSPVVLLVDDNAMNLHVLHNALDPGRWRLRAAKSGADALRLARLEPPAVILLDINMPEMDGFSVCRQLKQDAATQDSVVIFLTARDDKADRVAGLDLGAIDYIQKPFDADGLFIRVKQHVDNYQRQAILKRQNSALKDLASQGQVFKRFNPDSLQLVIADGEGECCEFKSTLRQNTYTKKHDHQIENAVLKTIAAFLNTSGGILLIGVEDDGQIAGVAADGFPSKDRLLLHLKNLIGDYIGMQFSSFLDFSVLDIGKESVLIVQVLPCPEPVFFRRNNKECYYVRVGPSTEALAPSQLLAYVKNRCDGVGTPLNQSTN